jgi:hypothetical protein
MRFLFFIITFLFGAQLHFDLFKKEKGGNTLLVIGGIHGNEPGGYYAASFLVTHYKILKGNLWIVPNLNFDSIIEFKRGKYGDMNRKFAFISKKDPDYQIVMDIKKIILNPKVDMILNLHDGHGFYRDSWKNSIFNPSAWGQTCIIDQKEIKSKKFSNLNEIAKRVSQNLNKDLKRDYHIFNVKNTKTKFKDEQMRLSLTYFAITHNKAAFAIETSKNIKDLATKIFYQLRAIEEFMKIAGIEYKRDFNLTIKDINKILKNQVVKIDNTILPLSNLKKSIKFYPFVSKNPKIEANPLVVLLKKKDYYVLKNAFRSIYIYPQFFKKCNLQKIKIVVDNKEKEVKIPSIVKVEDSFLIKSDKRVNVIGFSSKKNEANILIKKDMLLKRFSIDKSGKIYRVEIYDKDRFCGWILVEFR